MGRPRGYEPKDALERVVRLFWEKGYEETSMAELVEATGVSRYGFYSEFGDKSELFLECLDHYAGTAIESVLSPLEKSDASLPEIRDYFGRLLGGMHESGPRGCLIGNTAIATPHLDAALAERVDRHYDRMRAAFLNVLWNAVRRGQLSADDDAVALADYLVGVVNGCLACIRSRMAPDAIDRFVRVALERLW